VNAPGASQFSPGDLRVSDADRDRAISELSEHFQAGRITPDELEERSGLALRARTGKDLDALFADLPRRQVHQTPPATVPGDAAPARISHGPAAGLAVAALAVMVVSSLAAEHSGHPVWFGLWPLLVVLLILRLIRRSFGHEDHHEHWHEHGHPHDDERRRLR